jgi:RNA polymerase sigma factor (sigma-70 family)
MVADSLSVRLIREAKAGDVAAFEALLGPAILPGFRLAYSMLRDRAEAEDAVQEACFSAWRKVHQLSPETESLVPWFLAIVTNRCRTVRRGRWWTVIRLADIIPTARGRGMSVEEGYDLRQAVAALPEGQRVVLFLYFYLDLPLEQISVVLCTSPQAVKSKLHRALRRLRPQLDPAETTGI